ncbi:MAG: tetratricopeptide repeat protein [Elusimicrobiales bacterium]
MSIASALRRPGAAKHVIASALIAGLTVATFWPVFNAGFINGDDQQYVTANPLLPNRNWGSIFTKSHLGYYHPLTLLTYKIEYSLAGLNPAVFHTTNIMLHIANCWLAYYFALAVCANSGSALFAALLFAANPAGVESVAGVCGRKDVLCCLFFLGMLLMYMRYLKSRNVGWLIGSSVLFALALLSKPTIFMGVFTLFAIDWHEHRGWKPNIFAEKVPHLAAAAAVLAMSLRAGGFFMENTISEQSFTAAMGKAALAAAGALAFLHRLLMPIKLSVLYPYLTPPRGAAAIFLPVALCAAVIWLFRRKKRAYGLGISLFLLTLMPVLPFMGALPPSDRYLYIPALGVFLMAGAGLTHLSDNICRWRAGHSCGNLYAGGAYSAPDNMERSLRWFSPAKLVPKVFLPVAAACAVIAAAGLTAAGRARLWTDNLAIWNDAIAKYPLIVPLAYNNRGVVYYARGQYAQAVADYTRALELSPPGQVLYLLYGNRATAYMALNYFIRAEADFTKAVELKPDYNYVYPRRALAYAAMGYHDRAIADFTRALDMERNAAVYIARADAYIATLRYEKAIKDYNEAVRMAPALARVYANRGIAYGRSGKHAPALEDFNKALSLEPGNALAQAGRKVAMDSLSRAGAK